MPPTLINGIDMKDDSTQFKVLVERCETYDRDKIQEIVSVGMKELRKLAARKLDGSPFRKKYRLLFLSQDYIPRDRHGKIECRSRLRSVLKYY
jgi:hypothetical protein